MKHLTVIMLMSIISSTCFSQFNDANNFANYQEVTEVEAIKYFDEKNQGKDSIQDYINMNWVILNKQYMFLSHLLKNYSFKNNKLAYALDGLVRDHRKWDHSIKGCLPLKTSQTYTDSDIRMELIKLIHSKNVKLKFPWFAPVETGNLPYLKLYLEMYKDTITTKILNGLLVSAVQNQYLDLVSYLIQYGADPNGTDYYNDKIFAIYRSVQNQEIFDFLISKGAKVNPLGYGGNTLTHASRDGCLEVIESLLKRETDPSEVIDSGNKKISAFYAAENWNKFNSKEVLNLLNSYSKK